MKFLMLPAKSRCNKSADFFYHINLILLDMPALKQKQKKFYLNCALTFYKSPFQNSGETKKTLPALQPPGLTRRHCFFLFYNAILKRALC